MKKILLLSFLITVLLASCKSSTIYMDDLIGIKKGLIPQQADSIINKNKIGTRNMEILNHKYTIDNYSMKVFSETTSDEKNSNVTTTIESAYILIYQDNLLYNWGFVFETACSDDPIINIIATYLQRNLETKIIRY